MILIFGVGFGLVCLIRLMIGFIIGFISVFGRVVFRLAL
jgi:hypothetical protein